jgi:hypothetical protein
MRTLRMLVMGGVTLGVALTLFWGSPASGPAFGQTGYAGYGGQATTGSNSGLLTVIAIALLVVGTVLVARRPGGRRSSSS